MTILSLFIRRLIVFAVLALPLFAGAQTAQPPVTPSSQPAKKDQQREQIQSLVESQHYTFRASSALPQGGRVIQLTTEYTLKVRKDTISCDLPYYGRAYVAPIDPAQGGIRFNSTQFSYTLTPRKKGGWDVLLKPTDNRDVQQMSLGISEDGYAILQVISTNKQAISFNGVLLTPPNR